MVRAAQIDRVRAVVARFDAGVADQPSTKGRILGKLSRALGRSVQRAELIQRAEPTLIRAVTNDVRALTYEQETAKTSEAEEAGPRAPHYALRMWDLSAAEADPTVLMGHSSPIEAVAMTPDGRWAVSASRGRIVRVWDLEARLELQALHGYRGIVWHVDITPDGHLVVSASEDRTVRVWDLRTGRCLAIYTRDLPMRHCAVRGDGRVVVALDVLGHIQLLKLEGI
jgi:hypothetical protein